jgi:ribosomal protein S18 acetylase RimI-like enzyme
VRLMERGDFATCKSLFALSLLGAGAAGGGPPQPAGSDSKGDGGGGPIDGCCHPSVRRFVDGVLGGVLASWESLQRVYSGQDGRGAVWVAVTRTRTVPPPPTDPPLPAGVSVHAAVPPPALVGMVMAKRADASTVELQHLCVAESARRAGVGSGLCRAVLDWAAQGNAALCGLDTLSHMEAAARLYTALGFTHVGTRTMGRGVKEFTLLRFELRVSGAPVGAPGPAVVPVPAVTHAPSTGATAPSLRSHTSATASTGPPSTTSKEQRTAASQADTQRTRRAANAPPNGGSTAHAPSSATLWVTGAAIKLVHVASRRSSHFLVEVEKAGGAAGAGSIKLAPVDRPYDRLFALQSGKLGFGGQRGRFASFAPVAWTSQQLASVGLTGAPDEAGGRAEYVSLRSLGNPTKKNTAGEVGWHLCYRDESPGSGSDLASHIAHMSCDGAPDDVASLFLATLGPDPRAGGTAPTMLASTSSETHTVPTTGHSAVSSDESFRTNGYAVYRSAVPSSLTDRALFRINRGLGTPGALVGGGVQDGTGKLEGGAATCPEVRL